MISYQGRNRRTVNLLKTIYFDHPEWTPCNISFLPASWIKYRQALQDVVLAHPRVFPGARLETRDFDRVDAPLYQLGDHTDCWGVVWRNNVPGQDSIAVHHPLASWDAFESWVPPDPETQDVFGPRDWRAVERGLREKREHGDLATGGGLMHGFFYMLLYYLRGFENLMLDLATDEPRLWQLIEIVEAYNVAVIRRYLALGAEYMVFGEDLGLQTSLPISPAMWRRFIKPSYERMFRPCREAGVPIYLHSDGHILEIIPDLIEVGVSVLNPQFRANGLQGLQALARGKVAIHLDLDRQLFPFVTAAEIDRHIAEAHAALHLPQGGLMLGAECGPDVVPQKVDAICCAFERICNLPLLDD